MRFKNRPNIRIFSYIFISIVLILAFIFGKVDYAVIVTFLFFLIKDVMINYKKQMYESIVVCDMLNKHGMLCLGVIWSEDEKIKPVFLEEFKKKIIDSLQNENFNELAICNSVIEKKVLLAESTYFTFIENSMYYRSKLFGFELYQNYYFKARAEQINRGNREKYDPEIIKAFSTFKYLKKEQETKRQKLYFRKTEDYVLKINVFRIRNKLYTSKEYL